MRVWRAVETIAGAGLVLCMTGCPQSDDPVEPSDMNAGGDMTPGSDMSTSDQDRPDQNTSASFSVEQVTPSTGNTSGGTRVVIDGKGFAPGATVRFGGVDATEIDVKSPTQLSAVTPSYDTASTVDVEVVNPGGKSAVKSAAFTYQTGGIIETPLYCILQAQSPIAVTRNEPDAAAIYAVVFADGITMGAGQGAGVTAELGVGAGEDYQSFAFQPMTYNVDKDGLTPGDLSNDEYTATPPVDTAGNFRYVARVKTSDDTWLYCDLDGSDNGIDPSQLGVLDVQEAPLAPKISYCQLISDDPAQAFSGQLTPTLRARVFNAGITPGAGQGATITGELGYGQENTAVDTWTYQPLSYQNDADGLIAGDLANDDYDTGLLIPAPGTYRYVARFKNAGDDTWFYCDRDGHDDSDPFEPEQAGTIEVTTPTKPAIGFCQTDTAMVSVKPGEQTRSILARVYVQGLTEGAGAGAGLISELVWGAAGTSPSTWTNTQAAAYLEDTDGLVAGDLANDRHATTLTPPAEGSFDYAYRFSMNAGATWTWCDTDGSSADPTTFEESKVGKLNVVSVNLPDQCRIQYPTLYNELVLGDDAIVYGRVIEQGVTDISDDAAEIRAELWVGPLDADPVTEAARFDVVPMIYDAAMPPSFTEDEYSGVWRPTVAGTYKFLVRMSVDSGSHYALCDLDGGSFEEDKMGVFVVHALAPDLIDYCHVFQSQVTQSLADPNAPIFTAEVYEGGITDAGNANSAQIEAEAGYGELGANPALPGAYSWQAIPFTQTNPGNANNYEYQGSPYDAATVPAAGATYGVVIRARESGQLDQDWVYCDNLSSSSDFLINNVSTMTVTP